MKKRLAIILLALGVLGMFTGCNKDKENKKEESQQEVSLVNEKGLVVAADVENIKDYVKLGEYEESQQEVSLVNEKGLVVAADVENIKDYVKLGEYQNLEISEAPKQEVTEEVLENNIHYLLLKKYKPVEVTEDRAVQQDDTVNIDYTGYMDGEAFEGGADTGADLLIGSADTGADLLIGSGQFISGFEDGLVGHKKGEEVTLDLTFPDPYKSNESLSGKAVQFKVKINKISAAPELTDAWVAENTEFKTVDEFKKDQKKLIQTSLDIDYEGKVKADLFALVVENSEILKYPEKLMEETKVTVKEQLNSMYQMQAGITFDDYVKSQGLSEEDVDQKRTVKFHVSDAGWHHL